MSVRLFADKTPGLLLDGHFVHLSAGYDTGEVAQYGNKYYRVANPQQVAFTRYWILPSGDYVDVTLSNAASGAENIYPYQYEELNEVLIGIENESVLVYPIMPAPDRYMNELAHTGMVPSPTNTTRRYLGCYTQQDSPKEEKKFRMCFVKDEVPAVLRLYVDSAEDYEKVMLHFLVNRCTLQRLEAPSEEQKARARKILRYSEIKKGGA